MSSINVPIMDDAETFVRTKYPFIDLSVVLFPQIYSNIYNYDSTSCGIIAHMSRAGMKTTDSLINNSDFSHVSTLRLLGDMWQMFWGGWTSFNQISQTASGTDIVGITSDGLQILNQFMSWDDALNANPFSDIAGSFYTVIKGVTA